MNRAGPGTYEYHLRGELSDAVLGAFPELEARRTRGETILTGPMTDQSALFGVLARIESLGIHLLEVRIAHPGRNGATCDHDIEP
jgi:hypothetical protein